MIHRTFWLPEDELRLAQGEAFAELLPTALDVISRIPRPVVQICGPISTGGHNCLHKNRCAFNLGVVFLTKRGHNVFDQMPIERHMERIYHRVHVGSDYCYPILHDFYLPLFESGVLAGLHFLPGWESSIGACWERETAMRLGLSVTDFPPDWLDHLDDIHREQFRLAGPPASATT